MAASWECPSLPVISLPLKETSKASFLALKPLISSLYEEDGEAFNDEIKQLNQLREHASKPSRDYGGCNLLRRYYAQLHLLRARFPPESAQIVIDFIWKDIYTGKEVCREGLMIEQASILYNIGAMHSLVGGRDSRQTEQGMKEALTHFQCSAGVFAYLSEHYASSGCQDLSPQLIDMYCNLLLGQAQECLVEKSLKGLTKVKNLSISRVAMKVAEYYQSVLMVLESDVGAAAVKKFKDWPKLLHIKATYYTSIAHLYQANSLEEQNNFGFMIAFQQLALQKLQSIGKIPKGLPDIVKEAVKNLQEYLTSKLHESQKQNDQVYHELVPGLDSLEPAQGAELVKPVVFQPADRKATGSDIFSRLVPMKAYEAASVFSEEKAKILRSILSSVDSKNAELENFLESLNAEEMSNLSSDPPSLPADLLQQHQLLQGNEGSVRALQKKVEDLMNMSRQADKHLQAMTQRKQEEEQEEATFQERNGPRPESQVCAAIWKEVDSLQKYHQQAIKSNLDLKGMFENHLQNLLLLCGPTPSLKAAIPTLSLMDAPEDSGSQRFHEVMAKVDEMKRQRTMLVKQLREAMNTDDITQAVIGESGNNQDALIDDHMSKHRDHADIIRQNLTAQDCILKALTEANAQRAKMRLASQELSKRREAWFIGLAKSAGHYNFLQSKITEGVGFYAKLSESVERLHSRCMEVCNDRRKKRQNIERRASPSLQSQLASPPSDASRTPSEQGSPARPPGGGQAAPPGGNRPSRPPKKAELRGEPLPPRTQSFAVPPSSADTADPKTGSVGVSQATPSDAERMIQGLRETQDKQRAALGLLSVAAAAGMQDNASAPAVQPASTNSHQPSPESAFQQVSAPDSHPSQPGLSVKPVLDPDSHAQIPPHDVPHSRADTPVLPVSHPQPASDPGSHPQLGMSPGTGPQVPHSASGPHPPAPLPQLAPDPGPNSQVPVSAPASHSPMPASVPVEQPSNAMADVSLQPSHSSPLPDHQNVGAGVQQEPVVPSLANPALSQPTKPLDASPMTLLPSQLPSAFTPPVVVPEPPPQSTSHLPPPSHSLVPQDPASSLHAQAALPPDATEQMSTAGSDTTGPRHPEGGEAPSLLNGPSALPFSNPSKNEMPGSVENVQSSDVSNASELTSTGAQLPVVSHSSSILTTHPPSSLPGVAAVVMPPHPAPLQTSALDNLDAFQLSKLAPTDKSSGEGAMPFVPLQAHPPPSVSMPLSLETPSIPPVSLALPSDPQPVLSSTVSLLSEPLSLSSLPQLSSPIPVASLHAGSLASISATSHLESLLLKQQETIQSQTRQIEEQKEQLRQQSREVSEYRKEMEQLRLQHQLQEKDKLATTSNQSMLMQLLQSQQDMFSSQQGQVDKLSVVVDSQRREHVETEAKLQKQIAQEQERNQNLLGQLAQQRKDLEHYQQQAMISAQQVQAVQTQAQQYLVQIQERDKVLASYRDEHKKIVDSLEQQYRQRIQQLTQQLQELLSRKPGGLGGSGGHPLPSGLPPPMQPQPAAQASFGGPPERPSSPSRLPHLQAQGGQAAAWMGGPPKPTQPLPAPMQPMSANAGHPSAAPTLTSQGGGQPSSRPFATGQQQQHPPMWTSPGQQKFPGHGNNPPPRGQSPPPHSGMGPLPPARQPAHSGQAPPTSANQPSFPGQGQPLATSKPPSFPSQGKPVPTSQPSFPTQSPHPHASQPAFPGQGGPPTSQPSFASQGPPLTTGQPSFPGRGPPTSASQPPFLGHGPSAVPGQTSFPGQGPPPPGQPSFPVQVGHPGGSQPPPGVPSQPTSNPAGAPALMHQQQIRPQLPPTHSQPGQMGVPLQWVHPPQGQMTGMGTGPHPPIPASLGPRQVNPSQAPPGHPMNPAMGPGQPGTLPPQQPHARVALQPQFSQPQPVGTYLDPRTSQPTGVPTSGTGQPPLP